MTRTAPVVLACLLLAACQTNPKQTVLDLDTTDPKWRSAGCVAARKAVATYNDREGVRTATAVAGLVAGVPVAGALASARSMPAVMPAEVHTGPSRTKMRSGSSFTAG